MDTMSTSPHEERVPPLTIGWRLRMAQENAGVKRKDLAKHLGVSEAPITRWTHDKGEPPKRAYISQWALLTRFSADWLETGEHPSHGPTTDGGEALRELTRSKMRRSTKRRGVSNTNTTSYLRAA